MALMNRLKARAVATLGAGKYNDNANLFLHKRKLEVLNGFTVIPFMDGTMRWAWKRCKISLLKKPVNLANQWRFVLREGRDPIKERIEHLTTKRTGIRHTIRYIPSDNKTQSA
ncbi:hypothetical protein GGR08_000656 [Bartonella fuyuanensis]|uniref:Uncharacterized protein n=1 Tax=Bartonella fuyuanensis TaxID=1460968 RepID=A0A840E3J8_9HYPH|nr:hypothetical protein [Bartonella fuyuanensis]